MRRRHGIALVIALLALIALAGAIALSFFPALEAQRAGARSTRLELLAGGAELGLVIAERALTPAFLRDHPDPGVIWATDTLIDGGTGLRLGVAVTRTPAGALWMGSVARAGDAQPGELRARHLVAVEDRPRFPRTAAVISAAAPSRAASFTVTGTDAAPPGWTGCPLPTPATPALLIDGDSATYRRFGPDSTESLMAAATALADSATGPLPAAPVLLARDGAVVGPGSGEGILLAPGALRLRGPLDFAGVIVARGTLRIEDGVRVHGVVLAGSDLTLGGSGTVQRSSCAVEHAERRLARLASGRQWRWGISY